LEQVYAAILYYLHNKEAVSAYFTDWLEHGRRARKSSSAARERRSNDTKNTS